MVVTGTAKKKTKSTKKVSGGSNSNTDAVGWRSAISSTMSRPMSSQSSLTPSKVIASANAVKTPMSPLKTQTYTRTQKAAITIVVTMTIAMAIWLIGKKGTMSSDALQRALDKAIIKLSGYLPSNIRGCVSEFMTAIKSCFVKTLSKVNPSQFDLRASAATMSDQTSKSTSNPSFMEVYKILKKTGIIFTHLILMGGYVGARELAKRDSGVRRIGMPGQVPPDIEMFLFALYVYLVPKRLV